MKNRFFIFLLPIIAIASSLVMIQPSAVEARASSSSNVQGYHVPKIVDFACGKNHNLAIDSNGNLWQWGGSNDTHLVPTQIKPGTKFKDVRAGTNYSLALTEDNSLFGWSNYSAPSLLASNVKTFDIYFGNKSKSYSDYSASFFDSSNKSASLFSYLSPTGDLIVASTSISAKVKSFGRVPNIIAYHQYDWFTTGAFSGGSYHCKVTVLYSFGRGLTCESFVGKYSYSSRLEGNIPYNYSPSQSDLSNMDLSFFDDRVILDATLTQTNNSSHEARTAFVVDGDGGLFGLGYNGAANIFGAESSCDITSSTIPVKADISAPIEKVQAGDNYVLALSKNGQLFSWGSNGYGQLGFGDVAERTLPSLVPFFANNSQYSFIAPKGETYEGSFAIEGMTSYVEGSSPTKGSLTLNSSSGQFSYTPNDDSTGSDYFTIQASNGVVTNTYIVNVTIDAKPTWQPSESSFVIHGGESVSSGSPAIDADGDPLKFSIVQYPTKGTAEIDEASGVFTYVANEDAAGDDAFKIGVSDGYFLVEKTINIHIETPLVVSDTYERCFDTTASPIHLDGQLIASDADGDPLTWSIVQQPSLGELVLDSSTGNYTYDVDQGKTGEDSFALQVTDGVEPVQKEYQIHLYSIEDGGTDLVNVTTTGLPFSSKILTNSKNTTPSYSIKTQGELGDVTIDPSTGSYTYTPQQNTRGQDSFVVTVSHTYGSYDEEIFVYQNSIPDHSLVETNIVVPEGGSYSGSASCSDLDDGDILSYTIKNNPTKGDLVIDSATGAYIYTPLADIAGNDSFDVKVSDGFNEIIINVSVHIESLIQTDSNVYCVTSQGVLAEGLLTSTDKDGDALSYSLKNGASNGIASVSANGSYSYNPNPGFFGDDSFVASVTDGVNPIDISIFVHVNRKPIAINETIFAVANGSTISGDAIASDPDGESLTYTIFQQAKKGTATINSATGQYSYSPNEGAAGDDDFVIKASDNVSYVLITVNVHNETELIIDDSNSSLVVGRGKTIEGVVSASDADGDQLSYSVLATPTKGNLELDPQSGTWVYHCDADVEGIDSFEISVTDGVKGKTIVYNLSINLPPQISEAAELSLITNQGVSCAGTLPCLDKDGDALAYSVASQGEKGLVVIDSVSGQYSYTPNDGAAGDDAFVLSVSDGITTIEETISVHIETDIALEGAQQNIIVAKGETVNGAIQASDADGDELAFAITQQAEKGFVSVAQNGSYSYQANGSGAGEDSFIISVTDGIHTKTVTVFVWVESAPSFDHDSETIDVGENGLAEGVVVASDLDGDQPSYSIETQPAYGIARIDSQNGAYEYINSTLGSLDFFVIKAEDKHGNAARFTVNVQINAAPVVSSLALSVKQGKLIEGQIEAQDREGDALSYSISSQGRKGVASIDGTSGRIAYTANRGESGTDTFLVDVCDGTNHSKTLVTVAIEGNIVPEAGALSLKTDQGKAVSGTVLGSDADGDKLSYAISRGPGNGAATIDSTSGYFTYTPDHAFYGNDLINVTVSDGLDSKIIQISITVTQNQSPDVKSEKNYSVVEGQSCSGTISATDPEGDNLVYSISNAPRYGTVEIDASTGEWVYKADAATGGNIDSFTIEISDGFNKRHVVVKMQIEANAGTITLISGGAALSAGALIGVSLLIRRFLKRPR